MLTIRYRALENVKRSVLQNFRQWKRHFAKVFLQRSNNYSINGLILKQKELQLCSRFFVSDGWQNRQNFKNRHGIRLISTWEKKFSSRPELVDRSKLSCKLKSRELDYVQNKFTTKINPSYIGIFCRENHTFLEFKNRHRETYLKNSSLMGMYWTLG